MKKKDINFTWNATIEEIAKLRKPVVISRKSKVYVISLRKDTVNPNSRKLFLDKELAIKYWNEVGKDEYTYWEESIYDL